MADPTPTDSTTPEVVQPEAPVEVAETVAESPEVATENPADTGDAVEMMDDEDIELTPEELDELRATEVAFSWQASEYVHHTKDASWYAVLGVSVLVLVIISALLKLWLSIPLFLAMAAAVVVYARRPPRVLNYELTPTGLNIEGKTFAFSEFRSFGVWPDEEWHTIDLEPVKRFNPRLAILFDERNFDEIIGHLELHLPRVDRRPDLVERATRYLRF